MLARDPNGQPAVRFNESQPTIVAIATGQARAAIGILRVSGPGVKDVVGRLCGPLPAARRATLRMLVDAEGQPIDEALVLFFPGPRSFTGEDVAEFHVHGGRAVLRRLLSVILAMPGCVPAEPGAFTRRAFENGRLDLTQAEALADLIDAETDMQRRTALLGLSGALRRKAEEWRDRLIAVSAVLNAAIDFSDEDDVGETVAHGAIETIAAISADFESMLAASARVGSSREGLHVALAGPPNSGKSSLLNALAKRPAAIVSPVAGTTRDVIEVRLDLDGHRILVFDTAGLRDSDDPVEREGMRRANEALQAADLVLWLEAPDVAAQPAPAVPGEVLVVATKDDLRTGSSERLSISTMNGSGLPELEQLLVGRAQALAGGEDSLVTHARQREALLRAAQALRPVASVDGSRNPELVVDCVERAARAMESLIGRVDCEDVLDVVFSRFCIGK